MAADPFLSPSAAGANASLYGPSPGLSRFPLGDTTEIVYCPYDRTRQILSATDVAVLGTCQHFATLEEHARRAREAGKLGATAIVSALQRLADARILVPQRDLVARCLAHKPVEPVATRITSVCIPTRNRPAMLQRCVESYMRCAREFSREIDFVIVDSSDDPAIREGNVAALAALRKLYGADITYLGSQEKQDLVRRLAAHGVDRERVEFALLNPDGFPMDVGSNRNALLLSTVGECTVQVDDDTICRVMPWIDRREGVRFTSRFDPTEFAFMDEGGEVPAHWFEVQDFFALHESLLGRSAGELIERHGLEAQGFERPTATMFRRIENGVGRVAATALGVAGDSGMGSSVLFLMFEGATRENLMRSERVYRTGMSVHRLIRAAPQLTVVDDAYCMTLNLGLDNRRLLPPFMPVQRGEDDMFSAILRASAEGGTFGFVPWALAHDPPPRSRPSVSDSRPRVSSGHLVLALMRSFSPIEARGPERNLRALGKFLCDWGHAPIGDLEEFLRIVSWHQASQQIVRLEGLLQKFLSVPRFWADDVTRSIANLQAAVVGQRYVVPFDLEAAFGPERAMERAQRLVYRAGELLEVWPDLREAAGRERASGNPTGRQL